MFSISNPPAIRRAVTPLATWSTSRARPSPIPLRRVPAAAPPRGHPRGRGGLGGTSPRPPPGLSGIASPCSAAARFRFVVATMAASRVAYPSSPTVNAALNWSLAALRVAPAPATRVLHNPSAAALIAAAPPTAVTRPAAASTVRVFAAPRAATASAAAATTPAAAAAGRIHPPPPPGQPRHRQAQVQV